MSSVFNTDNASTYLANYGLNYTPGTLTVWRSQRKGPKFYRHKRRVFYLQKDLDAFIALATPIETCDSLLEGGNQHGFK